MASSAKMVTISGCIKGSRLYNAAHPNGGIHRLERQHVNDLHRPGENDIRNSLTADILTIKQFNSYGNCNISYWDSANLRKSGERMFPHDESNRQDVYNGAAK